MLICKNCKKNKLVEYFECVNCGECVHVHCLRGCTIPSGLLGDVFFVYTCEDCNSSGVDFLERDKMAWVDVLLLTLYNLSQSSADQSFNGYFHCNQHIKKFVNSHWKTLFPHIKTKRKSWKQMIASTLKSCTPEYFLCGDALIEFPGVSTGWYKLAKPDMLPNHALLDRKDRSKKKRKKVDIKSSKFNYFSEESVCCESSGQETEPNTSGISTFSIFCSDSSSAHENMYSRSYVKPTASLSEYLFAEEDKADEIDVEITDSEPSVDVMGPNQSSISLCNSDIGSVSCKTNNETQDLNFTNKNKDGNLKDDSVLDLEPKSELDEEPLLITGANSLFTLNENSRHKPWATSSWKTSRCIPLSEQEEVYLMSNLSKKIHDSVKMPLSEIRLYRKLKVRKLKRERNMRVFDLNNQNPWTSYKSNNNNYRILDRYQHQTVVSYMEDETLQSFRTRLLGQTEQYTCFVSPYTQRLLKPFIRRDFESNPLWLQLLGELQAKVNKKVENWIPPPSAPIDYSYVRPQHIPAINSLAQQYFWPGINFSECLQYPDFSCVVLYKKLIVAFAFLVPDVSINEAYISFIFTRPEWRRAGIGTFMLYHLIQTCMGRDITLHVSVNNPALFLYQKFGFKVEEFVQDFYERYLPIDSNQCKHALFLRLSRMPPKDAA